MEASPIESRNTKIVVAKVKSKLLNLFLDILRGLVTDCCINEAKKHCEHVVKYVLLRVSVEESKHRYVN